jgi:uncharacterized protein involved in exopolysaccharide biosynthesis
MLRLAAEPDVRELTLSQAARLVWAGRWFVAGATVALGLAALLIVLPMTRIYRAQIVLVATKNDTNDMLANLGGDLGGLAALAGISLPQSNSSNEALGTLRSQTVVSDFISQNDLLPILYAARWDAATRSWKTSRWSKTPTVWRGAKLFMNEIRSIDDDRKTGLITLTVEWERAELAAKWANELVALANTELRNRAIAEAERNIAYIEKQLEQTTDVELRNSLYRIMEQQIKTAMIARGRAEFAFRVVDPAVVPEQPVRPRRGMTAAIGALVGLLGSVLLVVRRGYTRAGPVDWETAVPSSVEHQPRA